MRLYDRLKMSQWTWLDQPIHPVIDASLIAQQIDDLPDDDSILGWSSELYGTVAPPWNHPFFIEATTYSEPHSENPERSLVQRGVVCSSLDREDPAQRAMMSPFHAPPETRWILCFDGFMYAFINGIAQIFSYAGFAYVCISDNGTLITPMDQPIPVILMHPDQRGTLARTLRIVLTPPDGVTHHLVYALKALAALNRSCPIQQETPTRQQRRRIERSTGNPATTYYVLQVRPTKRGLFEEVAQKPPQSGTAYHSVRGHFKTYREKPRFGRDDGYGTFWIPEHHRGTDTIGVINKDYRIHPDRDED